MLPGILYGAFYGLVALVSLLVMMFIRVNVNAAVEFLRAHFATHKVTAVLNVAGVLTCCALLATGAFMMLREVYLYLPPFSF